VTDLPDCHSLPDAAWRRSFRRKLRAWFDRHARDLPWRRSRDPYAIWVSEIMLQQTQVATVKPYFERFLAAFPTIGELAAAEEDRVLRLWEGLGYYRRARQLHQAAKQIVAEHGGQFPAEPEAVRRLPGIGRYTAGAILSIAFDLRQPILEANTIRVFSRLLAYGGSTASAAGQRLLWSMAEAVLPEQQPGLFNQALMDLGGTVCVIKEPRCAECPAAELCRANAEGLQARVPAPKVKPNFEYRHEAAILVHRRGRVLLLRCPDGARWAGLWDFPRYTLQAEHPEAVRQELLDQLRRQTGLTVELGDELATLRHGVTRFRITLDCFAARFVSQAGIDGEALEMRWVRPGELAEYPLSTTGRKLVRLIQ
jgi:A/G-specific adenine glycosylase